MDNVIVAAGSASMYWCQCRGKGLGMRLTRLSFAIRQLASHLIGIFAPGCVFHSTATVDLEFGSTDTGFITLGGYHYVFGSYPGQLCPRAVIYS